MIEPQLVPIRGETLLNMYLFCRANPLARPRKGAAGNMYQPLENQAEMIAEMASFKDYSFDCPIIVDHFCMYNLPHGSYAEFPISNRYPDIDNCVKAINDNLIRSNIIKDDRLIVGGMSFKGFSNDDYVVVTIYEAILQRQEKKAS